jgi:lipopolysaccharide transport system permease protein
MRWRAVSFGATASAPGSRVQVDPVSASPAPVIEIRPSAGWLDLDLAAVWRYRELLYFLIWREIKIRYKQASLGIAWAIIQPVLAVVIFTVVFGLFARFPSDGIPYALFAFTAVLPWTYFAEALRRTALGLVSDADLIRKIYFPRLIIPVATTATPLVDFAFGALALGGLMAWYGVAPTWNILALPFLTAMVALLALAVGMLLAPINVRYRDIVHTLPFAIQIWMFATPVVYPLSIIPERWQAVYSLNPMVGIIEAFRWSVLGTGSPNVTSILVSLVVSMVILAIALVMFRRAERSFADVI